MPNTGTSIGEGGIPVLNLTVSPSDVVQAPVDDTLSIAGEAADAKAVGDALGDVESSISDISGDVETIKGWTGEDIPVSSEDEKSIAEAISELSDAILGHAYPVGSIYMTTSNTAPEFGGSWVEITVTHTLAQLKNGGSTYAEGAPTTAGNLHYWLRTE